MTSTDNAAREHPANRTHLRAVPPDTKLPPHDPEAEQSALSCAMHSPSALAHIVEALEPTDFYDGSNRVIFELLCRMFARGEHVDLVTLKGAMDDLGVLGDIPAQYLVTLLEAAPVVAAWQVYTTRLTVLSRYRQMMDEGTRLIAAMREPGADRDRLAGTITARLQELLNPPDQAETSGEQLADALHELVDLSTSDGVAQWGLADLDAITRGFIPSRLILLAARPAIGKSSLAIQAAVNVARHAPVLYLSYEMSEGEISAKIVSLLSKTPLSDIIYGKALDNPKVTAAYQQLTDLHLTVRTDMLDASTLAAAVAAHHARQPLSLVVVDYLQLIPPATGSRAGNREQEVSEISRALRHLAGRLKIPVLALSQLNRAAEGRMPSLADLRESGSLEQEAHQVIFLHPPDSQQDVGYVEGMVAKNRMGRGHAPFQLMWNSATTTFANLA